MRDWIISKFRSQHEYVCKVREPWTVSSNGSNTVKINTSAHQQSVKKTFENVNASKFCFFLGVGQKMIWLSILTAYFDELIESLRQLVINIMWSMDKQASLDYVHLLISHGNEMFQWLNNN
jgi:hypothetical protein